MERKNTKRKRRAKKVGFLFFDLLFAFAISMVLITIVFICTTFLTSRFLELQEYSDAKQLFSTIICELEKGEFYPLKNTIVRNRTFTITNQICSVSHTPLSQEIVTMPMIKTTISWKRSNNQEKHITVQRFYIRQVGT